MAKVKIKLADALLRRKELALKVAQLLDVKKTPNLFEVKVTRKAAHEGIDDVTAQVGKLEISQVTAEYDHYASANRRIDSAIQNANWNVEIEVDDDVMVPYKKPSDPSHIVK